MKLFSRVKTSSIYNAEIVVKEVFGKRELLVNGIQQSGRYTQKLWSEGLPAIRANNILVFGVGGGTVFQHFPDAHITAVDIDPEIIHIAKTYFDVQNVRLIKSDARKFETDETFDLIIVDLYIGNDVPLFVSKKPFLLKIKRMLKKSGTLVINYFHTHEQEKKAQAIASILGNATTKPVLRNMFIYMVK